MEEASPIPSPPFPAPSPLPQSQRQQRRLTGWPLLAARILTGLAAVAGLAVATGAVLFLVALTFTDDTNGIVGGYMAFSFIVLCLAIIWLTIVVAISTILWSGSRRNQPTPGDLPRSNHQLEAL